MNKVDQRAEPAPQPGPWRACCRGASQPETLAVLLPAPSWAESAPGVGTGAWGREGGLEPLATGPGNLGGVKNAHYLFFGFVKGRWDFGEGVEEPALRGLPCVPRSPGQLPGPLPWARETAWGPRRKEHPHARPAANAIPEPRSVFPVWGPGPERASVCAAIAVSYPHRPCATRAFSGSLSPRQRSLSDGRACTCG